MALSEKQRRQLERLQELEKQPEAAPVGRHVNVTIDLGNADQVAMGRKMGFLPGDDDEDDDGDDEGDEGDGGGRRDETPKRKGFFPD